MTKIQARKDGNRYILSAKGHATGSVEVCAAISAIVYALAGYLMNHDIKISQQRMEDADVLLDFAGDDCTAAAFEMAVIGLAQIGRQYPEFLQVDFEEK